MSELYDLPNGWEWKTFDEVSTFIRGITFKPNEKYDEPNENTIICFRTTNIQSELDDRDIMHIDSSLVKSDDKIVNNGDILISSANSLELLGKCCLVKNINYKATLGGFIVCGRANGDILDEKYFYYFFSSESNQKRMRNLANKTTGIANLPIKKVEKEYIPLPPLSEQQLIVSKLDLLFQKIDKSIELHQKNMDEADAFMGSVLNEVFEDLEEKYGFNKLDDVCKFSQGIQIPTNEQLEEYKDGFHKFIRIINYTQLSDEYRYVKDYSEKAFVDQKDLVMVRYGATAGFIGKGQKGLIANNLFRVIPNEDYINDFIYYGIKNPKNQLTMYNNIGAAAMPAVNFGTMSLLTIPSISISIQQKVVDYLDTVSQKMEKVKSIQKEKMESFKALKASILDKAFRGEL